MWCDKAIQTYSTGLLKVFFFSIILKKKHTKKFLFWTYAYIKNVHSWLINSMSSWFFFYRERKTEQFLFFFVLKIIIFLDFLLNYGMGNNLLLKHTFGILEWDHPPLLSKFLKATKSYGCQKSIVKPGFSCEK